MTLRTRLVIGSVLVALAALAGSLLVADQQGAYVRKKTDAQLARLLPAARTAVKRLEESNKAPRALVSFISEAWIGRIDGTGRVTTVVAPANDTRLVPDIGAGNVSSQPSTHSTLSGESKRVRCISGLLPDGERVVVALPIDEEESMINGLRRVSFLLGTIVIALLALMVWWVVRLGINPLAEMTDSARRIAGGDTAHRVPEIHGTTEASDLASSLNHMVDELRLADDRTRRFIADVSHELRTPLTTLRGYSDLYESGVLRGESEVSDAMRRIRGEADRMERIVNDLIELRGVEEAHLSLAPCAVNRLLEQCASDLRVADPGRSVIVKAQSCSVMADVDLILQAVMAMGRNALDHTSADTTITLSCTQLTGRILVEVSDDGPGVAAEHRAHVFERLYRIDAGRHGSGRHLGIGLSLVASIVTAHRGRFGLNETPGGGATFWFDLPA